MLSEPDLESEARPRKAWIFKPIQAIATKNPPQDNVHQASGNNKRSAMSAALTTSDSAGRSTTIVNRHALDLIFSPQHLEKLTHPMPPCTRPIASSASPSQPPNVCKHSLHLHNLHIYEKVSPHPLPSTQHPRAHHDRREHAVLSGTPRECETSSSWSSLQLADPTQYDDRTGVLTRFPHQSPRPAFFTAIKYPTHSRLRY
ncbi:hypothetical protein P280DRAFT_480147 [Massarina eburnea CBS 473.64]|uniref:Uncharacterized protein n=1 Tax=Massarina eburnea CBS 473.64 TaxID=1395130 RepID=A0A6A6S0Q1_9PLEO|nr:hypothetical protein P280DRAFT_480147 [Massarina eburnea CBS 473.64]